MRFIYTIIFILSIFAIPFQGIAQSLELQGVGGIDCSDNLFHFTIQAQSADPTNINIGSFSVFFTFDESIMIFNSFNSLNFDGSALCDSGNPAWTTPKHGTIPGYFNMNFTLIGGQESSSCPTLDNNWVDIAEVVFDISDFPSSASLAFVLENTHFNTNIPNNGNSTIPISSNSIDISNCLGDYDNDGISDELDNCPFTANPLQEDLNGNNIGDACEIGCDLEAYSAGEVLICSGDMVTIAASGIGGVPPYSFEWDSGETTDFISVSETVTTAHYVTVTDSEGCIDKDTIDVIISDMNILPGLAVLNISPWSYVDTIYDGDVINFSDLPDSFRLRTLIEGTMECMVSALTGEMEYTRVDNSYRYDFFFSGTNGTSILEPGSYTMNLSAYNEDNQLGLNCANREINFTIVSDCAIDLGIDTSTCTNSPLTLDAVSSGVPPFIYAWNTGETTQTILANSPVDFNYVVTVTDGNGCSIVDHIDIEVNSSGVIDEFVIIDVTTGNVHDIIQDGEVFLKDDLPSPYAIIVQTTDVDGSVAFSYTTPTGVPNLSNYDNTEPFYASFDGINLDLPLGSYSITATTFENDWIWGASCDSKSISFTIESCPVVEMADDFIFCSAISANTTETITTTVTGDSGPYSYAWSDGTNADHIIISAPVATTTHYVSVSNSYPSCETVDSIVVYTSNAEIINLSIVDVDNSYAVHTNMKDGDIYNINDLPANYNFEAFTTGTIGSIRMELTGDITDPSSDNSAPYRFNWNSYIADLPSGNYTMTIKTHSLPSSEGPTCEEKAISFTIVDCPSAIIAGTEYDNCEAHSKVIPATDTWNDVTDDNGHILASFKTSNLTDLGTVTVDVQRSLSIGTLGFPSGGNVKLLPRHFHFASSNFASSANFPEAIDVRIYFTDEELELFNTANIGDYGFSNYAGQDLVLTHYFGNNQDCDYSNNTITPTNSERIVTSHQMHSCNGQYFEFSVNHFSEFILHEPTGVLPVELIDFRGKLMDKRTLLNWETAFEENVNGFEIERSLNTTEWTKLGFVAANNAASNYEFWDNNPFNGINYYRLKSVDLDGTFEYSNIVIIAIDRKNNILGDISPNPIAQGNKFTVPIHVINDMEAKIQITNQLGQIILLQDEKLFEGTTALSFDTNHYPNGFYTLQITLDNEKQVRKFEVVR